MKAAQLLVFGAAALAAWSLAIRLWPRLLLSVFKRAILTKGFGDGPIPVNVLYVQPAARFADPLGTPQASRVATTGVNRDTLVSVAWLDLRAGPQLLHVPEVADRYYSVQLTDPVTNAAFAYVGTRTTGPRAGDYLVTGPGWAGTVPPGATRIASPHDAVLVVGRVLVRTEQDLAAAHDVASRFRLTGPGDAAA